VGCTSKNQEKAFHQTVDVNASSQGVRALKVMVLKLVLILKN